MQVSLVGQSTRDKDNLAGSTSRLVNVFAEQTGEGVRWLKSVLGMDDFATLPGVLVTAMGRVDGKLYAVCGAKLYRIDNDGTSVFLGDVAQGTASIAGNNGNVTVQAGGRYFVWNGTTLSEPAPGAFSNFGGLEFFGNYTVLTERNGRRFQWSDIADPADLPGLNFATADGRDDLLIRPFALHGKLYLFKETSHETWFLTGSAGAEALERSAGGVYDIGLKAHDLICRFAGGAFMVGSDNRANMITAGGLQPVSTPAVETAIKDCRPRACISWEDEGHVFAAIVFRDGPAWVYDIATGEWFERAEGVHLAPWAVAASEQAYGKWFVGTDSGRVSVLTRSNHDGAEPLVREITSRTLTGPDRAPFVTRALEVFARQGFAGAEIELFLSRDSGHSWTPGKQRPLGVPGKYDQRIIWRGLGSARSLTAKLRWTAPADINISTVAEVTL